MKALVPLDGSENSLRIFETVRKLLGLQPEFEIHLLEVRDPRAVHGSQDHTLSEPPSVTVGKAAVTAPLPRVVESRGEAMDRDSIETRTRLAAIAAREVPGAAAFIHVLHASSAADAIKELADELEADVIVMATHGRTGLRHLIAGSVTEALMRTSSRPVLVQGPAAG